MKAVKRNRNAKDVLLFVPNIVGYVRILLTSSSLCLMIASPQYWLVATCLYIASFVGDLFDGLLARKLKQTSEFGGLMDMLTDRLSTLGLLYVLSGDYQPRDEEFGFPVFRLTFLTLIALDIASHWSQMFSTAILGAHHKGDDANAGRNFVVRLYYGNYIFFGYLCVATEILYIVAYAFQFTESMACHKLLHVVLWVSFPGCLLKQLVNVIQLFSACYAVARKDAESKIK